jgi:hypothetical protein
MPQYEFKCRVCWLTITQQTRELPVGNHYHVRFPAPTGMPPARPVHPYAAIPEYAEPCDFKRVFGFSVIQPMQEHYNPTTGSVVSNSRQFRDGLKIASERETARTGIEHNYVEVDPTDAKALGVTEEGLDSTARRLVAEGKKDVKTYL